MILAGVILKLFVYGKRFQRERHVWLVQTDFR